MSRIHVKSIKAIGVHNRFDIEQKFEPGINIIYGFNGSGKTTLLNILANILNSDFRRFAHLKFRLIEVNLSDGNKISLGWNLRQNMIVLTRSDRREKLELNIEEIRKDDIDLKFEIVKPQYLDFKLPMKAAYFPTFRLIIDAWESADETSSGSDRKDNNTFFARKLFGQFIPYLHYPSALKVESKLNNELNQANKSLALAEHELFSQSFNDILLELLTSNINQLPTDYEETIVKVNEIQEKVDQHPLKSNTYNPSFKNILSQIHDSNEVQIALAIIKVYESLLKKLFAKQIELYAGIKAYLSSINSFLVDKQLMHNLDNQDDNRSFLFKYIDDTKSRNYQPQHESFLDGVQSLSSGERQIMTLLYAAHISAQDIILIDEPETSLHVDWQRRLLEAMISHLQDRQLIICTHSPIIPADYDEYFHQLNVSRTDESVWNEDPILDFDKAPTNKNSDEDPDLEP